MTDSLDSNGGYRAYLLDESGRIAKAVELHCQSDEQARAEAKQLVDGCGVELWEKARLIARFAATRSSMEREDGGALF